MSRNVLIVVQGGRIQDILCDDPDVRVLVKNFDDAASDKADDAAVDRWPVALVGAAALEVAIES